MSIKVQCPACQAKMTAPDKYAGRKVKCPKCKEVLTVPQPPSADDELGLLDLSEPEDELKPSGGVDLSKVDLGEPGVAASGLGGLDDLSGGDDFGLGDSDGSVDSSGGLGDLLDDYQLAPADHSEDTQCPKCGAARATGAVLCVQCGFHYVKGEQVSSPQSVPAFMDSATMADAGGGTSYLQRRRRGREPSWELDGTIATFYDTAKSVLFRPLYTFDNLAMNSDWSTPAKYTIIAYLHGYVIAVLLSSLLRLLGGGSDAAAGVSAGICGMLCLLTLASLAIFLSLAISAAMLHLGLIMTGPAEGGINTTFQVVSYVSGALFIAFTLYTMALLFASFVMPAGLLMLLIMGGMYLVTLANPIYLVVGLARAQNVPPWRALVAIIMPVLLTIGATIGLGMFMQMVMLVNRAG